MARAVYSGATTYMFDDVLSAVDAHVCEELFEGCISVLAKQTGNIVVFVAHQLQFCPKADHLAVLDHGRIVEQGTYDSLMSIPENEKGVAEDGGGGDGVLARMLAERSGQSVLGGGQEEEEDERADHSPPSDHGISRSRSSTLHDADLPRRRSRTSSFGAGSLAAGVLSRVGSYESDEPVHQGMSDGGSRSTSADAAGDLAGVLVNEEARASGNVSWDVYSWYIGHLATPCLFISFLIMMVAAQAATSGQGTASPSLSLPLPALCSPYSTNTYFDGQDYWLVLWTSNSMTLQDGSPMNQSTYMLVFALFGVGFGVFTFLRTLTFILGAVRASTTIHDEVMVALVRSPMAFFDTTPLGRILTRVSSDMSE